MSFRGLRGRWWFLAGGMFLVLVPLVCAGAAPWVPRPQGEPEVPFAWGEGKDLIAPGPTLLAEVVQREDSVVYRTDGHDAEYRKREREEREKEQNSWNMLNNVIIDGRQPPRRFSDPFKNDPSH